MWTKERLEAFKASTPPYSKSLQYRLRSDKDWPSAVLIFKVRGDVKTGSAATQMAVRQVMEAMLSVDFTKQQVLRLVRASRADHKVSAAEFFMALRKMEGGG